MSKSRRASSNNPLRPAHRFAGRHPCTLRHWRKISRPDCSLSRYAPPPLGPTPLFALLRYHVPQVVLKPRKAGPFYARHPWVLDSAVQRVEGEPADGEAVELLNDKGKWIAHGIYNSQSKIRVRLYSWIASQPLDESFWRERIHSAISLRQQFGYDDPAGAARLVFSEADGLSGLIVDRFADYLALQITSQAMAARLDLITSILVERLHPRAIMLRTEKGVAQAEGLALRDGLHWGTSPEGPIFITEHGLRYGVDLAEGQKTGFYVDQRENRLAAARYMHGRNLLDMFCYSGGFSLVASARGHARSTRGFDASARAITLARANAELNGIANAQFEEGNGFEVLDSLLAGHQRFDAIVLDPPKFARRRQATNDALRAYHRLNRLAVDLLTAGGILVTCSCSGHITREDLLYMLAGVSQKTGRDIQILEQHGASPDHPISATCLESEYLKCFICRIS